MKEFYNKSNLHVNDNDVLEYLHGALLGDSFAENIKTSTSIRFKQSVINKEYLLSHYKFFSEKKLTRMLEPEIKNNNKISKRTGLQLQYLSFNTYYYSE